MADWKGDSAPRSEACANNFLTNWPSWRPGWIFERRPAAPRWGCGGAALEEVPQALEELVAGRPSRQGQLCVKGFEGGGSLAAQCRQNPSCSLPVSPASGAIVADQPGTTRDWSKASWWLEGVPLTLAGPAGNPPTDDPIRAAGHRPQS